MASWEGGVRTLPSAKPAGAYAPSGRISAAAKAMATSAAPVPLVPLVPWARTGRCDVEDLLIWAYQAQQVNGSPTDGLYEVEALGAGLTWYGSSSDGCAAVERIGMLGTRVDQSGASRGVAHAVAELVALHVSRHVMGETLRHWATVGSRPGGWKVPELVKDEETGAILSFGMIAPEFLDANGEAGWVYRERRQGANCPVVHRTSWEMIERGRMLYAQWWDALDEVGWMISTRPLGFLLEGPRAPREPWVEEVG